MCNSNGDWYNIAVYDTLSNPQNSFGFDPDELRCCTPQIEPFNFGNSLNAEAHFNHIGMITIQQLYCKADKLDAPVPVLHFQGDLTFPNSKMARRVVLTLYKVSFNFTEISKHDL